MNITDKNNITSHQNGKPGNAETTKLQSGHTFHIPVMGLAFTVDSPVKVARFGISSVISIIEDRLMEMMRGHYCAVAGMEYYPISVQEPDYRAKRITNYLNLVNTIVHKQMLKLREEAFEIGSEVAKYFEMLPNDSILKNMYSDMIHCPNPIEKAQKQSYLKSQLVAGSIDVNILTKLDGDVWDKNGDIISDGSNAVAALRGYINSDLSNSSIVFSAGLNPRLYNYLERTNAFDPDQNLQFKKRVIIKVSDYRSALVQGKFLAKKGIWVSEFRIESGLNCGGHAFATTGYLLGPVLEEFKIHRQALINDIFEIYKTAISNKTGIQFTQAPSMQVTVQGGVGTYEEDCFLRSHYDLSGTGWGSPFLLVPEATTVDDHTLQLLSASKEEDVILSTYSPMGIPFYYLKGTTADVHKHRKIAEGKPGSPCPEKLLQFNTEFTERPICSASQRYQSLKLEQLKGLQLPEAEFEKKKAEVLAKDCLCVGLSNAASLSYNAPFLKKQQEVNVCPGPNIANFSSVVSLQKMIDHIYGRTDLVTNKQRPHVFIAELKIYINYLKEQLIKGDGDAADPKRKSYYQSFLQNMGDAIRYYQQLFNDAVIAHDNFEQSLKQAESEIAAIKEEYSLA